LKVLNKYITREFLRIFILSLIIFQSIYVVVDLFERADEIASNNIAFTTVLQFFIAKIPLIIFQVTPVAVLLSTVSLLTHLSKNHELTAIKAGGISFNQVIKPILFISLIVSALTFAANETVLPWTNQIVKSTKRIIQGKAPLERLHKNRIWMRGGKDMFINISMIEPDIKKMFGVIVYFVDDDFKVKKRIDAEVVEWASGKWIFKNGSVRYLGKENKFDKFSERVIHLSRDFDDFLYVKKTPVEMSYTELKTYISTLKDNGYKSDKYIVDLYAKFSIPLTSFIMALIGIPFSIQSPRKPSFSGIGLCIGIGFIYWMFLSFGLSLGHKEAISPVIGAWIGNVVFGILALYMLRGKRIHFF